jgi:hypothetical protein
LFDETLTLNEGLNEYTITVTSKDESNTKEYSIRVIKLPDLSLQELKLTNESAGFVQDLPCADMQELLVSYKNEDIKVTANATDDTIEPSINKTVSIDAPSTIENVKNVDVTEITTVTVTVTKNLGIDPKYQSKSYVVILRYIEGITFTPMAEGGFVSFIPAETSGQYDEVHIFEYNTDVQSLTFKDDKFPDGGLTARVLVVGGGGSGGNVLGQVPSSGGGAGGMVEHDNYQLTETNYSVKVGAGGKIVADADFGAHGEDSTFGAETGLFTAYGGGGGARGINSNNEGTAGGSSGGNNGNIGPEATKGTGPDGFQAFGNAGGKGGRNSGNWTSGGGGGAGGPGSFGYNLQPGGQGRSNNITGASVVYAAGGSGNGSKAGAPNTGNGGDGRHNIESGKYGMAGGSGIVIVRFPFTPPEKK